MRKSDHFLLTQSQVYIIYLIGRCIQGVVLRKTERVENPAEISDPCNSLRVAWVCQSPEPPDAASRTDRLNGTVRW